MMGSRAVCTTHSSVVYLLEMWHHYVSDTSN